MSEQVDKSVEHATGHEPAAAPSSPEQLANLMGEAAKSAPPPAKKPDLDQQAIAAAEHAVAEGKRALQQADAALQQPTAAKPAAAPASRTRELVLRSLLAINLIAMVVVVFLPDPAAVKPVQPTVEHTSAPTEPPPVRRPSIDDPVIRAFAAADQGDYRGAIRMLDQHLADSPRLDPAKKANILLALQHYTAQIGDFARSQEYQRKVEALRSSHSMPEDLLAMAAEAEKAGDVESMRRHYAKLLLQQRQIPTALVRHVAEAYLKLGDSYRQEAEQAAQVSRQQELDQLRKQLRQQAASGTEEHK